MAKPHSESGASETQVLATENVFVFALPKHHQEAAQKCLEKNGEVRFSIKEVSLTKLPQVRGGDGVLVD
jgi:hypothetical protein